MEYPKDASQPQNIKRHNRESSYRNSYILVQ